jgi:predicted RNase H-like HicB family nuclease
VSNGNEITAANSGESRDRPFDAQVVEQARALAAHYQIRVERHSRGYLGKVVDLPTIFGFGTSEDAALRTTREHLKWALAYLIETGRTPSPGSAAPSGT